MWKKPWTFKEGFLIGGGLIFAGLMLELSVGPVVWEAFVWPANGIVLAGFIVMLTMMAYLRKKVYALNWMSTYQAAIPAMAYAVALTIIMGVTRQQVNGTWINNMLSFWPFVLIYVYIDLILGLVILRQIRTAVANFSLHSRAKLAYPLPFTPFPSTDSSLFTLHSSLLSHLGLFLALTTATLGSADMQRVKMICGVGEPEWRVMEQGGAIKEMPIAIELKKFIMETYDDGKPKRYASEVQILTQSGKNIETTIDVNKPCEVDGWKIYQYGYDTQMGAQSQISIFELVSDPWLPWVYAGFYMMLAGAAFMTLEVLWRRFKTATRKEFGWYLFFAASAALFAYFFFDSYNTKTLVPALQSPWFAPHVFVYIFAYCLLGIAVVIAWWKRVDDLVYVSFAFLTIGMLFGALWAKEAWGHYWSWDPKETWAAITWIAYLIYIHYRQLPQQRNRLAFWMLIGSFVLLQMCWWGINYLPSAQGSSVHTYSTNE